MANVFVVLPVPTADGVGAWVDVSGLAPSKTISVDGGFFSGTLFIESSNDGQASSAPVDVPTFVGTNGAPSASDVRATLQFMRVRRKGSGAGPAGAPTVSVGAAFSSTNIFGAMNVPAGNGTGAPIDLSAGGPINTFNLVGPFSGQLLIDVSADGGTTWSPEIIVGQSSQTTHGSPVGQNVIGSISTARVRIVGAIPGGPTPAISVGSGTDDAGGGGSFPGYGGAPPAVAPASAAGTASTVSRSDHTHAGVSSFNGAEGAVTGVASVAAGTGVTVTGTAAVPIINSTGSFPGFGGPPPAVAIASSTGVAATASHSDHTHAGVSTFNTATGDATFSVTAGTGISIGGTTNAPTVTNTGVISVTAGTGITLGGTAANPVINATGVTGVNSITAGTGITLGGTSSDPIINATATSFPGFGGPPPAVAAASATGTATTASHSDHTHAGVSSFNTATGAATFAVTAGAGISIGGTTNAPTVTNTGVISVTAGTGITLGGTAANPVINSSGSFPGFGGAPPPIAAASAAGSATTASRSDHTHEGVHTVNGTTGDVTVTAFPGFGGAPPAIAAAGAAGTATTASRSDHTHAGVTSFNSAGGAVTGVAAVTAGTGITLGGTTSDPIINATATTFPGFGGPPPAVAAASATGTATTASHSDHTHAGVATLTSGTGISVTGPSNTPTISNTGVLSVTAGTGITLGGSANNPTINAAVIPFYELSLAYGGGPSPGTPAITGSSAFFWLQAVTNAFTQFVPGNDSAQWEWPSPINATTGNLSLNVLNFTNTLGGSLTVIMTINGSQSGTVGLAITGVGVSVITAAQALSIGDRIGLHVTGGGGLVTTNFTARLRVS